MQRFTVPFLAFSIPVLLAAGAVMAQQRGPAAADPQQVREQIARVEGELAPLKQERTRIERELRELDQQAQRLRAELQRTQQREQALEAELARLQAQR